MHPKDFWQLGGASWFLLGWAAATVLTKYRCATTTTGSHHTGAPFFVLPCADQALIPLPFSPHIPAYSQHRSALTIRQPRNLDNLLAQLVANLNKVLRQVKGT